MSTLKQITTKAKALYKTGKFAKWTDAIKAASATISKTTKKVKKAVTKKAAKKIGYKKDRMDILFRATPLIRKYKASGYNREDAIKNATIDAGFMSGIKKKPVAKKKVAKSYHKDTKSHNVRINVLSGSSQLSTLHHLIKEKEKAEQKLPVLKMQLKNAGDSESKKHYKFWINRYTKYLSGLKKQITEAKKHI